VGARLTRALRALLPWLPIALLWFLLLLRRRGDFGHALAAGLLTMLLCAFFGHAAWWLSGRLPGPRGGRGAAVGAHLLLGTLFVLALVALDKLLFGLRAGWDLATIARETLAYLRPNEWTYLLAAFYAFVATLAYWVRAERDLADQRLARVEAEAAAAREALRSLRARLNPHFLLNVLHSIGVLTRRAPPAAELALERLGGLLRYVLDDLEGREVELGDEWRFVEDYLAVERLRLGAALRVECELDPELLELRVPPFTLQLLVENALRHGLAGRPAGGCVRIDARRVGQELLLSVQDDGNGAASAETAGTGLGLRALRRQLETRAAGAGRLLLTTAPGQGLRAEVWLPLAADE
jgi:signal transduction histidine kinase